MKSSGTGSMGGRPMVMGRRHVVSSGHYLATQIGMDILNSGGNAVDAAAAVAFAMTVVIPHQNGICGEVPTLVYWAAQQKVWSVSGHGVAPGLATLDRFGQYGLKGIPGDGLLPALVPPVPATWIALLERFGTMRLADVLGPAVELAREGFAIYDQLHGTIAGAAERFTRDWPSSAAVWLVSGKAPEVGALLRLPEWAATFSRMLKEEAKHKDRVTGLRAAADFFYRREVAKRIAEFCQSNEVPDSSGKPHPGLLREKDLADYQVRFEEPATTSYRGVQVYKCGTWTQGPVLLQALNLLEGYDLAAMGHNSADYIHTVVECMKLAFADREFYYGDPAFADVPLAKLLSKGYAAARRQLVDPHAASMELRPGDHAPVRLANAYELDQLFLQEAARHAHDTTKLEVIDSAGNMVSSTPSGGWLPSSPIIPGLGFPLGTRGQMFSLAPNHPNCLQPGKRPRTTLTPSLALRDGKPFLSFGSPGGDAQDQWALQFLINVLDFDMPLQHAVEAATFWTTHFPSSFFPRPAEPGAVHVEGRIPQLVRDQLAARGHIIKAAGDWVGGNTVAAGIDPATGVRCGAATPRMEPAYALAR